MLATFQLLIYTKNCSDKKKFNRQKNSNDKKTQSTKKLNPYKKCHDPYKNATHRRRSNSKKQQQYEQGLFLSASDYYNELIKYKLSKENLATQEDQQIHQSMINFINEINKAI